MVGILTKKKREHGIKHTCVTCLMVSRVFSAYAEWVRRNADNVASMERFTHMLTIILMSPNNMLKHEIGNTIVNIQNFSNHAIISSAGRKLSVAEQISIVGQIIRKAECLLELLLRRYRGHRTAWNFLLILQLLKCFLNLVAHQQMCLLPSIWQALRRQLRRLITFPKKLLGPSGVSSGNSGAALSNLPHSSQAAERTTPLVIPRVVATRMFRDRSSETVGEDADFSEAGKGSNSGGGNPDVLPCTAYDVLGAVVDFLLLLRPLFLLYCARSAFPTTAMDACSQIASEVEDTTLDDGPRDSNVTDKKSDYGSFFSVKSLIADGLKESLLGNWSVWTLFLGLDVIFAALARYIFHYRKPIVCINRDARNYSGVGSNDGRQIAHDGEVPSPELSGVNSAAEHDTVVSRDSLRVQQTMHNLVCCFLRDPFFGSVLRRFIYDNFIIGRINGIPLVGSLLALHVASFLCRQHYSFMYSIGE